MKLVNHNVTFFIPLGVNASKFAVSEKTSIQFDQVLTEELDQILDRETKRISDYRDRVHASLLLGSLLVNGGWSWPIWLPFLFGSCATAPAPTATYETESSTIAIYDLDQDVDLQALIDTTGLDPSVTETLSRYQDQQIAIIDLQTEPWADESGSYGIPQSHPGIHLSWETNLVPNEKGEAYTYPLGTGAAWSHPIEITRVSLLHPLVSIFRSNILHWVRIYQALPAACFHHAIRGYSTLTIPHLLSKMSWAIMVGCGGRPMYIAVQEKIS